MVCSFQKNKLTMWFIFYTFITSIECSAVFPDFIFSWMLTLWNIERYSVGNESCERDVLSLLQMEMWRQCATWLVECRVLPESHRATWEGAQVRNHCLYIVLSLYHLGHFTSCHIVVSRCSLLECVVSCDRTNRSVSWLRHYEMGCCCANFSTICCPIRSTWRKSTFGLWCPR